MTVVALVGVRAEAGRSGEVAEQLAQLRQVRFVGCTAGSYDVVFAATFASRADLLAFFAGPLTRLPGIRATETSELLEVRKGAARWAAWAEGGGAGLERAS